jgi:hypothetical protein
MALKTLQTSVNISFLDHLPIYGQWSTFIFQMGTYIFFVDSVFEFFF